MNLSIDLAQESLRNPPPELKDLLEDPRVPKEAMDSIKAEGYKPGNKGRADDGQADGGAGAGGKGPAVSGLGDGRLQVVNEKQEFSPNLSKYMDKWGLLDKGFAYDVVAVFGSQSTGKSTLLNRLFGTNFDVMDESRRQQTTKGIWLSPSAYSPTIVMDVEGTDGRERGEDQDFERKSALFSLAGTEVLLVNLWEHQIGLYQGANMGLLKTVFEVNLGLFGGSAPDKEMGGDGAIRAKGHEKTLLMFVIRDFVGSTPLANLTQTLTQDMEKIWTGLSKPEHLTHAKLSDYFDLTFAALPHKVLMPEKFEEAVVDLRKRFTDRDRQDFVFKPTYHKRIPADGVGFYLDGIWQQVLTNKDLDLPTQQELLAQFRCDEIAAVVLEQFEAASRGSKKPVESGSVVEGLGGMMGDWKSTAMSKFDKDASRYHPAVYTRKRAEVAKAIEISLLPLHAGQLKNLHTKLQRAFKQDLEAALKGEGSDFAVVDKECRGKAEKAFVAGAEEMQFKDATWSYTDELGSLRRDLKLIADQCRSDETKKMINSIERNVKKQLIEPVEVSLSKPSERMWDNLMITFKAVLSRAEKVYMARAKTYNCTDEENDAAITILRRRAWTALHGKIMEQLSDHAILAKLRDRFEDSFRYDASGVPRVWTPNDDIDSEFRRAKEQTLDLIPLLSKITIIDPEAEFTLPPNETHPDPTDPESAEFDFQSSLQILSETKKLELENRFKKDADAYYVEAKRSVVSTMSQIPSWVYGLLLVLGRNDLKGILFNPLQIVMVAILGAGVYLLYQLGMMTPLIRTSRAFIEEFRKFAVEKLREIVQEHPEQATGAGVGRSGGGGGGRSAAWSGVDGDDRRGDSLRRKETVEMQEL